MLMQSTRNKKHTKHSGFFFKQHLACSQKQKAEKVHNKDVFTLHNAQVQSIILLHFPNLFQLLWNLYCKATPNHFSTQFQHGQYSRRVYITKHLELQQKGILSGRTHFPQFSIIDTFACTVSMLSLFLILEITIKCEPFCHK